MSSPASEADALLQAFQGLLGTSNLSLATRPIVQPTYQTWYPLLVAAYALLVLLGALLNAGLLAVILQRRLHRQPTVCLLANLAVAHLVQGLAGLPLTLAVMLLRNWVFGAFLCYFVPMLQDVPVHVSVITFVTIAYDRYRFVQDPSKQRLPALVIAFGSWLTASCIVVPYPIYVTHVSLSIKEVRELLQHEEDLPAVMGDEDEDRKVEYCFLNLSSDIEDYHRCMFALLYVIPALGLCYLYAQTERLLNQKERPVALVLYDTHTHTRSARSASAASVHRRSLPSRSLLYHASTVDTTGLDVAQEQRTQKYLAGMTSAFFVLFTPLNLLRLNIWKMGETEGETYENAHFFDSSYAVCVWLGYLPTCTMPLIVASWMLSRSEKERVRGYFRFSNRRLTRSGGHRAARSGSDPGLPPNGASSATGTDGGALSTPGPSPPHGALAAHGTRNPSVATASTAITNLSPPASPRPTPRPSPRPQRGDSAPAPPAAAP